LAWLYRYSIRHPRRIIAIAVLVTLSVAPGILRLKLRTDGHALVPPDAPEIQHDHKIREDFGLDDPIVVFIRTDHPDGIFNSHTLQLVQDLTDAFEKLEHVHPAGLFSLATEVSDKVFPGTLRFRRFLDPIPQARNELLALRESLRGVQLYNGTLISNDDKATAVLVGVPSDVNRMEFLQSMSDVIAAQGPVPEHIDVIGAPVAEGLLGTHILEDLGVPTSLLGHRPTLADPSIGPGIPHSLYEVQRLVARYVGLVPLAFAIMAVVFFVSFRSVAAVALPLTEVAAALVVIFAMMGWLGIPVYLTTAVIPVILTATGITDEIHLFSRYRHELRLRPDEPHVDVLRSTMDELTPPVLMTTISTAIGFLSFALSTIGPVQAFGFFTAGGIVFCMFWSLSVIPALLTLIDPKRFVKRQPPSETSWPGLDVLFRRLGGWAVRYRWVVLVGAVALAAIAPLEIRKVVVQDSWIDGFAPRSEFRRATDAFNEEFLGTHILQVCVDAGHELLTGELRTDAFDGRWMKFPADAVADPQTLVGRRIRFQRLDDPNFVGPPSRADELRRSWWSWIQTAARQGDRILVGCEPRHGSALFALRLLPGDTARYDITTSPLLKPEVIRRIADLESFIEGHHDEAVGGVRGTSDYMATINYMRTGRKEVERKIPDNVEGVEWNWGEYERLRGYDRRRQLVDSDYGRSIVTVLMKNANFVGTARLMREIREYERINLAPHGISLSFAGDVAVSQTLIDAIVGTQVVSVLGSLVGDFLVTAILGRSLIFGLLCILPSSLAVLLNFAVMGWVGMPLGVATSMFSAMTLGIGVDYAIHLLERYRLSRAGGQDVRTALTGAVATTGSAIFVDTLAVCLGFGILILSQVPANARLGGLLVLSLINCFVATMLILPAILSVRSRHSQATRTVPMGG
jgi:predicted RND superfamily exporter protein